MNAAATAQPDATTGLRIRLTREALLYAVILLVAIALRAPQLGAPPLSEHEAHQAMAAWRLLRGNAGGAIGAASIESPLVFAGAAFGFAIFGASEATARLLPMLAGVGLVLLPIAFRKWFGRLPMLVTSGLLALSPGAVAASRQMTGGGAAVLCTTLALWAFWRYSEHRQTSALAGSGVWLGLALIADFSALVGIVGLLFGVGAVLLGDDDQNSARDALQAAARDVPWRIFIGALVVTVFLVSTLSVTNPRGLGAAADLLGRLARGVIRRPPNAPFVGGLLLLYEPVIFLFGAVGLLNSLASEDAAERFLSGWTAGALLIGFTYPGALPAHVLWMVVPLVGLAGLALTELLAPSEVSGPAWSVGLHAAFVMALLSVATLLAISLLTRPIPAEEGVMPLTLRLALVGAMSLLVVVTTMLWASIWGNAQAWRGLGLGLLGIGLLVSVTGSAGLAYVRASEPREPWNIAPGQPALDALVETARDVSTVVSGHPLEATVTVQGPPDGLVAWALRDFQTVSFVQTPNPEVNSDMVVTVAGPEPLLGERYVGQDFVIVRAWRPTAWTFDQALRWLFFREANSPASEVRVILWVREDIYLLLPNEVR
jgi:4-amino-4-deoxy-L-arabinose transferase-like glycosyltransferase